MTTNPNMHTENISDDGEITDSPQVVACYYYPCVGLMNADGYLRVFGDAPGHYSETRVDHATLIKAGWTPPQASPENGALCDGDEPPQTLKSKQS